MTEFDFSDRTDAQMRAVIVLAGAYKARWAELEKAAKESVRERMGFNEHEAAYLGGVRIGEVNRSRPGRGSRTARGSPRTGSTAWWSPCRCRPGRRARRMR